jgi:hypothetical protein
LKPSVLIGIIGGIVIGLLQFYSMHLSMELGPSGTFEMFLYYSPQLFYIMCIYMSIKIFARSQDTPIPDFKGCLKAGGITAILISLLWGIGFFVALTHLDVAADVKHMLAAGADKKDINDFLSNVTKQVMMDRTQFWIIPNFLLGFAVSVLVTVIFRLKRKSV